MPLRRPKRWNLAEKRWTSYGVLSVDPFPIKKLHQFKRNWILAHKKNEQRNKNFKTMPFRRPNDRIWLKNDDSPGESFPLTYFKSKSCTNLPQTEFWRKKQNDYRNKNFEKKCYFGGRKRWNLAKKRWTSYGVLSVDPFPIEKMHQFKRNWILGHKKN